MDLETLLHRYVDCLNRRAVDEVSAVVAEVVVHNGERMTREEWWEGPVGKTIVAMPDFHWNVEEAVVCGDRIFVRYQDEGTPSAPWLGHEPNGGSVSFREYVFYTAREGKLVEFWSLFDGLAAIEQLARS